MQHIGEFLGKFAVALDGKDACLLQLLDRDIAIEYTRKNGRVRSFEHNIGVRKIITPHDLQLARLQRAEKALACHRETDRTFNGGSFAVIDHRSHRQHQRHR